MLFQNDHILVALSGGPDSVALLLLLLELQNLYELTLGIAHINHKLRGEESDRDEAFVRELARRYNIPCHVSITDVPAMAKAEKRSFEETARNVRYAFYKDLAKTHGYQCIALGHNSDDNAELVLMNLLRGSGTKGLAGIPPTRPLNQPSKTDISCLPCIKRASRDYITIVRPMIEISRKEIMEWLDLKNQPFVLDSSNSDKSYLRNRIRHSLIPHLEQEYNPSVKDSLNRLSQILMDEDSWMSMETEKIFKSASFTISNSDAHVISGSESLRMDNNEEHEKEVCLPRKIFSKIPKALARRLARRSIEEVKGNLKTISMGHIEDIISLIYSGNQGKFLDLPGRIRMIRSRDAICFRQESRPLRELGREKCKLRQ
ncbi:tRNA(Ile)-lysidine synthase [Desulfamplus magnetovallimortis]|uniref:tRNA(Ile)-lysidine synthase n=1 Tax=Desulfamplus magnetovallimortis TaxID=1246637 RepID=A0A1W1H716_9BACT|nr:tRNA lysidine(34) synthetase TilS [Desulfamplus magnetovallimortis]SLM28262.1 tRNA(Ile)-lysidine synthase [Desulfamplus magnetovallimortis]